MKIVSIAGAIGVATFLALVLLPVPHNFTIDGAVIPDLEPCSGLETLQGTTVTFHWSAPSPTYFFVVSCSENQEVYAGNGTKGSGSFESVGGAYEFGGGCPEGPCVPVDVSGRLTGPLLNL